VKPGSKRSPLLSGGSSCSEVAEAKRKPDVAFFPEALSAAEMAEWCIPLRNAARLRAPQARKALRCCEEETSFVIRAR
jgi:hypothetical protein